MIAYPRLALGKRLPMRGELPPVPLIVIAASDRNDTPAREALWQAGRRDRHSRCGDRGGIRCRCMSVAGSCSRDRRNREMHALRCYAALVFLSCAGRFRSHRPKRRLRPGRGIKLMSVTKRAPPRRRSSTILRLWKASSSGR
jgi:hypothetical protein